MASVLVADSAARVRAALIGRGIVPGGLEATGYGPSRPVESDATAAGRLADRRVDFVVLETEGGQGPRATA